MAALELEHGYGLPTQTDVANLSRRERVASLRDTDVATWST